MAVTNEVKAVGNNLAVFIKGQFDEFEKRVDAKLDEIKKVAKPETLTDKLLDWVKSRRNSWAWVVGWSFAMIVLGNMIAGWLA